jgi:hypothetical protein
MIPTVFREKGYRFFFLSNEEERMHVHAAGEKGEAKFWLEPIIALADYHGLRAKELNQLLKIVMEHRDEIIEAWQRHFPKR